MISGDSYEETGLKLKEVFEEHFYYTHEDDILSYFNIKVTRQDSEQFNVVVDSQLNPDMIGKVIDLKKVKKMRDIRRNMYEPCQVEPESVRPLEDAYHIKSLARRYSEQIRKKILRKRRRKPSPVVEKIKAKPKKKLGMKLKPASTKSKANESKTKGKKDEKKIKVEQSLKIKSEKKSNSDKSSEKSVKSTGTSVKSVNDLNKSTPKSVKTTDSDKSNFDTAKTHITLGKSSKDSGKSEYKSAKSTLSKSKSTESLKSNDSKKSNESKKSNDSKKSKETDTKIKSAKSTESLKTDDVKKEKNTKIKSSNDKIKIEKKEKKETQFKASKNAIKMRSSVKKIERCAEKNKNVKDDESQLLPAFARPCAQLKELSGAPPPARKQPRYHGLHMLTRCYADVEGDDECEKTNVFEKYLHDATRLNGGPLESYVHNREELYNGLCQDLMSLERRQEQRPDRYQQRPEPCFECKTHTRQAERTFLYKSSTQDQDRNMARECGYRFM